MSTMIDLVCQHHNDAERAAATCPCCLMQERDRLKKALGQLIPVCYDVGDDGGEHGVICNVCGNLDSHATLCELKKAEQALQGREAHP